MTGQLFGDDPTPPPPAASATPAPAKRPSGPALPEGFVRFRYGLLVWRGWRWDLPPHDAATFDQARDGLELLRRQVEERGWGLIVENTPTGYVCQRYAPVALREQLAGPGDVCARCGAPAIGRRAWGGADGEPGPLGWWATCREHEPADRMAWLLDRLERRDSAPEPAR